MVNRNDQCHLGGFPGPLREVTGVWAEEYSGFADHRSVRIEFAEGLLDGVIRLVQEGLHLQGAEALATFNSGRYAGQPAVIRNRLSAGWAYYLGAKLPYPHPKPCWTRCYVMLVRFRVMRSRFRPGSTPPDGRVARRTYCS